MSDLGARESDSRCISWLPEVPLQRSGGSQRPAPIISQYLQRSKICQIGIRAILKRQIGCLEKKRAISKVELLFSSVGPLTLINGQVKCTIFLLKRGLKKHCDLYVPGFSKSTSEYLYFTKEVRMHGSICFSAMSHFWMLCF